MRTRFLTILSFLLALSLLLSGCAGLLPGDTAAQTTTAGGGSIDVPTPDFVPAYTGEPYYLIGETPAFTEAEKQAALVSYEYFSPLDALGRCGVVHASVGVDLMPTEDRGSIGMVKPSGWQTVKYDVVSGKYLYNRCHLIGFQLTGENANERNLITGTRYMNVDGMLPFEDMVAAYVKDTENHVLYRVTPFFSGNDLVAGGVRIEALSIEDDGEGISFDVFVYNVQPMVGISYANGTSWLLTSPPSTTIPPSTEEETETYILNTNTFKFHKESCQYANSMKPENREVYVGTRADLIVAGYDACGSCKP